MRKKEKMNPVVSRWNWQTIFVVYRELGQQLSAYNGIQKRIGPMPQPHIELTDESNTFLIRWWKDINRINEMLKVLDAEIRRRNNLVGVMG
jgi:hypothetical protein